MTCERVRDMMCEYMDGTLNGDDAAKIQSHIEACEKCRAEAAGLREALTWIKQAEEIEPPAGLRQSVLARLAAEKPVQRRYFLPGFSQAVAAAAVFVMLVAGNVTITRVPGPAGLLKTSEYGLVGSQAQESPGMLSAPPAEEDSQGEEADQTVKMRSNAEDTVYNSISEAIPEVTGINTGKIRLVYNLLLTPVFLAFTWLALRKRREA